MTRPHDGRGREGPVRRDIAFDHGFEEQAAFLGDAAPGLIMQNLLGLGGEQVRKRRVHLTRTEGAQRAGARQSTRPPCAVLALAAGALAAAGIAP